MAELNYAKLRILVADDFSSFRNTVNSMLSGLGVANVVMAANAEEMLGQCERARFDIILSDYNLGAGRTGQNVLEELRFRKLIDQTTLFILVSAESSRNIVMSAYDCAPDDYLMKPLTTKMLQQRMNRLLVQRSVMAPVYQALQRNDLTAASELLIDLSLAENRHSTSAQKMLGGIFVSMGEWDKAERLYTRALEVRPLEWARLGLAKVRQVRGELEQAGSWLEKIVDENPLYLPAYDVLADNWGMRGDSHNVQFTVQRAVDVSPMSILRQKQLATVAQQNSDLSTATEALRKTVKLGQMSCHGTVNDHLSFARVSALGVERELNLGPNIHSEALAVLKQAEDRYELTDVEQAQVHLLAGRIHALNNQPELAIKAMADAERLQPAAEDIDVALEGVSLMLALKQVDKADERLEELAKIFADDQAALEKLDQFLNEPASESNRAVVAEINREGIELYNRSQFDAALDCFESARKLFPKHVGIQLNIVQALVGKLKIDETDELALHEYRAAVELVASLIDSSHPQFDRYNRLKNRAGALNVEQ